MSKSYSVSQVSDKLSISSRTLYRYVNQFPELEPHLIRKEGKRGVRFTEEAMDLLVKLTGVETCHDTSDNVTENGKSQETVSDNDVTIIDILKDNVRHMSHDVRQKNDMIQELMEQLREERQRHDTIIMTLTQQVQNQSKQLEDLRKKPEVVRPKVNKVSSIRRKAESVETGGGEVETSHPKENWGLFMQAWVKMFQPWKMRRDYKGKKAA